ncbi:MAG: transcription termination factor NusA [Candidatus Cloacimonetes bacterium]|nr:transcription termination factor NusA [Candidatus Cloacimonadota bacterium]MCF7813494.1 transcription termination factor NusA [Candidatus Cloacimonadota bacterium]MCF7868583.1 transcription termination factor NusA [Candidatus Cloacimonadota bacterium]MCF7883370.1 transcription termination factor NusA [Candidatus Cloacimonadota bacterium]
MSANLMSSLAELASLKQLDKNQLAEIIKESLYQAISKKMIEENDLKIIAEFDTNRVLAKFNRIVVERDFSLGEISLEEAKHYEPEAELGDLIPVEMYISDFEPKVIRNARKAILERIKALEENRIMDDYENQKDQIISGKVTKDDYNGYVVDIGYADALLPKEEQIEDEYFKVGDIIKAFVVNIRKRKNDVIVILSRTRPEFVKRIFETEIPEVNSGDIDIKKIVREPGMRTKVAVISNDKNIDATAACLGEKGIRIESIRNQLNGELVDIVLWAESPEQLIANAIGPDLVEKVYLAERGRFARIIVSEDNKNLAIGKKGKNVKLAAKLTDFKLDIYTEEEFEEKISEERRITSHVSDLDGVSAKVAEVLKEHGYTSVQDIYDASIEELCNLEGLGKKTANKIKESSKFF